MRKWKKTLTSWIPGIVSGSADNDPSGILTYAISGARFGFNQLWLLALSTPMLIAVQAMCARLGDVKRAGLMKIIQEYYSPVFVYLAAAILIITNTTTLGADLVGVSEAFGLITNTKYYIWVIPIAIFIWWLIVFHGYRFIERFLTLLSFLFLAYAISGLLAQPDWQEVFRSLIFPPLVFTSSYLLTALGVIGTTITPYLFFWQSKQELEERLSTKTLLSEAKIEDRKVAPGFIYSNLISMFIIISTASIFQNRETNNLLTIGDAARALEPIAGLFAKYLFAFGIIGAGFIAIPILATSSAYAVAEIIGWRDSLSDKVNHAKGFYAIISISVFLGILLALSGIQPVQAIFYSQVLNGILAPVLIIFILQLSNDSKVMGENKNRWFDNVFGIIAVIVMLGAVFGLLWPLLLRKF